MDNDFISNITVYPNPTTSYLNIQMETGLNSYSVSIYTTLGKMVYTQNKCNSEILDISRLQPGAYYLKIDTDKGSVVKTILKK